MIRLLLAAALLAWSSVAHAQMGFPVGPLPTATGQAATGQIPGTATNDSACTTCVGYEIIANSPAANTFTATITIASPAVITGSHTFTGVNAITFTTTGALPTGIVSGTTYYTGPSTVSGAAFNIATSVDNAIAGTFVNTSGTQSGTQTANCTVALSTTVGINVMALPLLAGEWDVWISANLLPAATTTVSESTDISISATSATRNTNPSMGMARATPYVGSALNTSLAAGPVTVKVASTTTYYGVLRPTFAVSTMQYNGGTMRARRVR